MSDKPTVGLPAELVEQIAEHSPAGHLLFYINSEGGVQIHSGYDSELSALALQNFCSIWVKAVQENQKEYLIKLFGGCHHKAEDSSEE